MKKEYEKVFYVNSDSTVVLNRGGLSEKEYDNMRNIIEAALLMTGKKVQVYEYEYLPSGNYTSRLSDR